MDVALRDGRRARIRPIGHADKALLQDAFTRLSPLSRYRRFFTVQRQLSPAMLEYLTAVDHHDHEALVAIDPASGELVGVARFVRLADEPTSAELAVTVVDDWQSDHLGTALVEALATRAREEGIERFTADLLWENTRMRELLKDLGEPVLVGREDGVESLELPLRD